MLVLRRRPNEAIVFDGGLVLTLAAVNSKVAWIAVSEPTETDPVVVGLPATATDVAELSVRSPRIIERSGDHTSVEVSPDADPDSVLVLSRPPGATVEIGSVRLRVATINEDRCYLELEASSLPAAVTLSVVSVSTVDARIGVNAPAELRVYRKEVWDEMQAANTAAAGEWTKADLAALSTKTP
jgi:sRNA-binding carbon storage regulator CsrA